MRHLLLSLLALLVLAASPPLQAAPDDPEERTREMFGELRLIDEVIPGQEEDRHRFTESPRGVSQVREILGRPTRVLPNEGDETRYVYFRLGQGMGLQANRKYVLQVDYPEDAPRMMIVHNRGAEIARGLHTGPTAGDALIPRYVNGNIESLNYPLSGQHEPFQLLFVLHERYPDVKAPRGDSHPRNMTPADGIPVIISQWKASNAPRSQGAAFSRIALYEVVDPDATHLDINYPPEGLPRRHLFWREEMSDGLVGRNQTGWDDEINWYRAKAEIMRYLGMNTYAVDLLEFGHNQGWDSAPGGGNEWVNQSHRPKRWENILRMLADGGYDFTMLPYYEYAGSVGSNSPGTRKYARPLGDIETYTHITWSEKAYADITDERIVEDAKKVIDLTVNRWSEVMPFTGAWFRVRPSHIPVSFSDDALAKFSQDVMNGRAVTREQLRDRGRLYEQYIDWWNKQRRDFFVELRDHMRNNGTEDAMVLFTSDASEPGVNLRGGGRQVVTDDVQTWQQIAREKDLDIRPVPLREVVSKNAHLEAQLLPRGTWGQWEWDHAVPGADPQNYKDTEGIALSYTFNRIYTVSSPRAFDYFRTPAGLAIVRHYSLNEHEIPDEDLGYFVVDMDRTRAHMMHAETVAMANGDPHHIGYLSGHVFNRGFPWYARRFNQAFLSLPALPSEVVADASSDREVVVRSIQTDDHGTWLIVANTSMHPRQDVTITLPAEGDVFDSATDQPLEASDGRLRLSLDAAELRAIHIR